MLSFAIIAGDPDDVFKINSETGEIRVVLPDELATSPTFALTVEVTDSGDPAASDSATVIVNVTPTLTQKRNIYKESYQLEIDHFIECIQTGKAPRASGAGALPMLQICDALYESAAENQEVRFDR